MKRLIINTIVLLMLISTVKAQNALVFQVTDIHAYTPNDVFGTPRSITPLQSGYFYVENNQLLLRDQGIEILSFSITSEEILRKNNFMFQSLIDNTTNITAGAIYMDNNQPNNLLRILIVFEDESSMLLNTNYILK